MLSQKKILVNGLLAAGVLAMIGYFYAQAIVMLTSTQPLARAGAVITPELLQQPAQPIAAVSEMMWRLPLSLAFLGFSFVVIGEGLVAFWKSNANATQQRAQTAGMVCLDLPADQVMTEAETQRVLREMEAQETVRIDAGLETRNDTPTDSEDILVAEVESESVFQTH
jgi:hypothetical protein